MTEDAARLMRLATMTCGVTVTDCLPLLSVARAERTPRGAATTDWSAAAAAIGQQPSFAAIGRSKTFVSNTAAIALSCTPLSIVDICCPTVVECAMSRLSHRAAGSTKAEHDHSLVPSAQSYKHSTEAVRSGAPTKCAIGIELAKASATPCIEKVRLTLRVD